MTIDYTGPDLPEFLDEKSIGKVTLIEPGGNHGDEIIYRGMRELLEKKDIKYNSINVYGKFETTHTNIILRGIRRFQREANRIGSSAGVIPFKKIKKLDSDLVLVHGGANINEFWIHGIHLLNHLLRVTGDIPVAVAPQTYFFKDRTISEAISLHKPVHLFCREKYSYSLLNRQRKLDHIHTYLSKDTAQYLSRDDLSRFVDDNVGPDDEYTLLAFRDDKEAIISEEYKKILKQENSHTIMVDSSRKSHFSFDEFVSLAENAESVHTDRLHVGILCSILENNATLYDNIYYKNAGVYDLSLKQDPNVDFMQITDQISRS